MSDIANVFNTDPSSVDTAPQKEYTVLEHDVNTEIVKQAIGFKKSDAAFKMVDTVPMMGFFIHLYRTNKAQFKFGATTSLNQEQYDILKDLKDIYLEKSADMRMRLFLWNSYVATALLTYQTL